MSGLSASTNVQTPGATARGSRNWAGWLHHVLSNDFCPGANRWVYWLKNPFWVVLAAALTAVFCGIFVSPALLVFGGSLTALLALGVAWPWITIWGASATLRYQQTRSREGEPTTLEVDVVNDWPWPVWGLQVRQRPREAHHGAGEAEALPDLAIAQVAGWSKVRFPGVIRPAHRGVYPLATPQLECAFPFGLYTARKPLTSWNQLIVWPGRAVLSALPDAVEIESREDRTSDRRAGDVGDVLGTRAFRQGDSLRRVHWAQSARQGRLIVCERQTPVSCALRLILDLEPAHHAGTGAEASLERLLRVAASVLESMHAQHATIECVIGPQTLVVGSSAVALRQCLDALAAIPPTGLSGCLQHGLCCPTHQRHRSLSEFLLTTELGFAEQLHHKHWSDNHHYLVVGAAATPTPEACLDHRHCACKPWLVIKPEEDVLSVLPRAWQRACRVA